MGQWTKSLTVGDTNNKNLLSSLQKCQREEKLGMEKRFHSIRNSQTLCRFWWNLSHQGVGTFISNPMV